MKNLALSITLVFLSFTAHAEILSLQAEYSVPTLDSRELEINSFQLEKYEVETFTNGNALMRFKLPKTMVGHNQHSFELKLIGVTADKTKILSSLTAKATCLGPWVNMTCSIAFTKLTMNKSSLKEALIQNFPENEVEGRFQLLSKFNTDPIGTVKVSK